MRTENIHWIEQDKHAIVDAQSIADKLQLNAVGIPIMQQAAEWQPIKITPYYFALLDAKNPDCPLRRMVIPDPAELKTTRGESEDPIKDTGKFQPCAGLTHRHPDRVLLYPSMICAGYCRYCFRRRRVGVKGIWDTATEKQALQYIVRHDTVREVILTGGEPLMLSDARLFQLLRNLRRIPHLRLLRIHTKMPAFNPFRLTHDLLRVLSAMQPLWVVTHFNHPRELTPISIKALTRLRQAGVPLLNQSVLLRNVNDNADVLRDLSWRLAAAGVKPYYLHHLDPAVGTAHFKTSLHNGRRIWRELWGTVPGYLVPRYVRDLANITGKIPL